MAEKRSFRGLKIWQKGIDITLLVYEVCKYLPKDEMYGLQSQLKRASVSIPANIAEGFGRDSDKSFAHFLKISRGSLFEVDTLNELGFQLSLIHDSDYENIRNAVIEESKMLTAFINKLDT